MSTPEQGSGREALHARRWRRLALACCAAIVAGNLLGVMVDAGLRWDFGNFYDAGQKVRLHDTAGLYDKYATIAGHPPLANMLFVSPPLAAAFWAPLTLLPPIPAMRLFKLLDALALAASLLLLYRRGREQVPPAHRDRYAGLFALTCLVFMPLWTIYRVGGQTTPFVLLAFVLALEARLRGRDALAAGLLVFAVVVKPAFAPALALLALTSGWPFLLWSGGLGLLAAGVSVLAFGWPLHQEYLDLLRAFSTNSVSWVFNSGLTTPIESLRVATEHTFTTNPRAPALTWVVNAMRVGIVGLFAWLTARALRELPDGAGRRALLFQLATLFALAIAPIAWEHYLTLLVIPFAHAIAHLEELPRKAAVVTAAAVAFGAWQFLSLVMLLWNAVGPANAAVQFAIGLAKCAPLLLMLVLFAAWRPAVYRSFSTRPA